MASPFTNMLISIPAMILSRFIDISTPEKLNLWRLIYILVLGLTSAVYFYILNKIKANPDKRKIWIERKMLGISEIEETTYEEHESRLCQAQMSAPIQGGLMTLGLMSFYLHLHYGILMQVIMFPINLYRNPLVKKYILNMNLDHPYNELTECPPSKMSIEEAKKAVIQCIQSTWDQCELADYDKLQDLMKASQQMNPTTSDGWTPFMILMGNTTANPNYVDQFIKLGCDYTKQDKEGDTPLHWAAYHNNVGLAEALFKAVKEVKALELCVIRNKKGQTPYDLAKDEKQEEFVNWIKRTLDDYYTFLIDTNVYIPEETEKIIKSIINENKPKSD